MIKIPKDIKVRIISIGASVASILFNEIKSKIDENEQQKKEEKLYIYQKQNGWIKIFSVIFILLSLLFSILSFVTLKWIVGVIGVFALTTFICSYLICIDIIQEKKHNIYKIVYLIGNMFFVTLVTLYFVYL